MGSMLLDLFKTLLHAARTSIFLDAIVLHDFKLLEHSSFNLIFAIIDLLGYLVHVLMFL